MPNFKREDMIVTGSMIQESLMIWIQRKDFAAKCFKNALWQFEDDTLGDPLELIKLFDEADKIVAGLQNLQDNYNSSIPVTVDGEDMTLADAIKRIGGAGRMAKMWKDAAESTGSDRYSSYGDSMTRKADEIVKQRKVSVRACMTQADQFSELQSKYRLAIRKGNQEEREFEDTPTSWFI